MTAVSRLDAPEPTAGAVTVLYIGGAGRCGSTLLDRWLGQHPEIQACGEIRMLWREAFVGETLCGCGRPLLACDFWTEVLDRAYGGHQNVDADRMRDLEEKLLTRRWPSTLIPSLWGRTLDDLGFYLATMEALYRAIRDTTGCKVIVDSGKDSLYAAAIRSLRTIDLRVVHLVRDPRATAHSWRNPKPDPGRVGSIMWSDGPVKASLMWILMNHDHHAFGRRNPSRYQLVRYEDFVVNPAISLGQIGALVDLDLTCLVPVDSRLRLEPTHSAWGNADRFSPSDITLRYDDAWIGKMRRHDFVTSTMVTAPWLRGYGYPIRRRSASPSLRG
jgi:hypothetical protein